MRWYLIRTKPRQENRAEFNLRQLSVETFLPLLRQRKMIRRQEETVVEPLFPRYLFARFDIHNRYRTVNFARGVLSVVEFGLRPAEVSESLIESIKERVEDGYITPQSDRFNQGQVVYIKGGPLSGLEAVFVRELKEQHRVLLLLRALGLHARLTVDATQVSLSRAL